MSNVTLKVQLEEFEKGNIIDYDGKSSTCYNFYDWFCQEKSLKRKSIKLYKQVKRFVKQFNIDTSKYYVFFKNNCPMIGPLYDDFRICDFETGDVIYNVTSKSGHSGNAEIYSRENGIDKPLYEGSNLSEIYKSIKK